ncbi:DotA/TraY family protein [Ralstonia mannitolilytica]|uniref:DotA/TraY family protein n=1 Tax=Ralstonia mannitolilytica TaxID=105219 RepID=A0AAJ4ZJD9_9RALS|nr:DotA/TraY family protein [Ralstonia mannitolilytica]CAG2142563.1 hypothetical protein LMG6866_02372 [Ralstonia mannitolilytica]SUD86856.1 Uncharacterised protein [Ralstonia mannitolilytica]SUD96517.1 Uncharacterised protein [Ralstonia mannitolilytica]
MKKITRTMIALLAALLPGMAMAANLFDVPQGDISIKVLGAIFGSLVDSGNGASGSDPLLNGIKIFNGGCLIIGGILAAYTILAGTLNTAHDGEMLGKKFSSVWIPVRYSIGTALVLPVVGGGYCVMQALVMWLVVQGIGLADGVWSAFMSNPTSSANTNITAQREKILTVAKSAFQNSVCWRAYARAISESNSILKWGKYNYTMTPTSKGYVYGDSTSVWNVNGCGEVNYPQPIKRDTTISNSRIPSTNSGYLGDLGTIFAPMDISPISQAQNSQLDILVSSMDKLAAKVIATAPKPTADGMYGASMTPSEAQAYYNEIEAATDDYIKGIKSTANGLSTGDAYSKIQATANNQGWILAGAWFTRIIQMNDSINKAVNSMPTSKAGSGGVKDSAIFGDAEKYMAASNMVFRAAPNAPSATSPDTNSDSNNTTGVEQSDKVGEIEAVVTSWLTTINLYELKNDSRHPLIIMNELGNRLVALCFSIMGGLVGLVTLGSFIGKFFGAAGAINNAIGIMSWFVDVPVKILMGTAMMTSYILPNMPFIIWIGCITGWVLLVIEAIIAAPLWAIMHLHPNGDDLTGRGGNGYSLVLSLLLRPVLMVFGMEAAIIISSVIGEFINKTFFEVFAQNTGTFTGWSAITALAMGTVAYCIIMFIFIRKCFGIIHQLPDQLLQWLGGPTGSALGQFAGEFSGAADKGSAAGSAAAGFATSGAGKLAAAAGKKVGDKIGKEFNDRANDVAREDEGFKAENGANALAKRNSNKSMRPNVDLNATFKDNWSAFKRAETNREAYNEAFDKVGSSSPDKEAAQNEFADLFSKSEQDNHRAYGGSAIKAAGRIGEKLVKQNLDRNLSNNPDNELPPEKKPD